MAGVVAACANETGTSRVVPTKGATAAMASQRRRRREIGAIENVLSQLEYVGDWGG